MTLDFKEVAERALSIALDLLQEWFPQGKKTGTEYTIGDLSGAAGSSLSININSGIWKDFSSGEGGADLISLYAAANSIKQFDACQVIASRLGYQVDNNNQYVPPSTPVNKLSSKSKSPWQPVLPVPSDAIPAPVAHPVRGRYDTAWVYRNQEDELLGYVCRFTTSDGGKEILPLVYAQDTSKSEPSFAWRWNQFPEPRPLYGLDKLKAEGPILIVEGEKCTDAGNALLEPEGFSVLSWSGGARAVKKADWGKLAGRQVVLWPDCDSNINKKTGKLFHKTAQPGYAAMQDVAKVLNGLDCKIYVLDLPEPGELPNGWDIADMIEGGADLTDVLTHMRANSKQYAIEEPVEQLIENNYSQLKDVSFSTSLLTNPNTGSVIDCHQNITLLLEELPEFKDQIKLNKLTERINMMGGLPWDKSGAIREWQDTDDLELMDYLFRQYRCSFKTPTNILNGVSLAASRQTYHPLADWLSGIKWDGVDRLSNWLHVYLGVEDDQYSRLVGPLWMRQAVQRALNAGSKADYVLILEGRQGLRKSTALRVLGGEWFSDAPMDIHNKDLYQIINGTWIYEIAELDMFNRAETTAIKAFITRPIDRYRAPYGRHIIEQRRHTVFAGSTNSEEYFKDSTGNRRFWPVKCTAIDIDGLANDRAQLFAQAVSELAAGKKTYPTYEEEQEFINPVQLYREITDAWEVKIASYLAQPRNKNIKRLTMVQVMEDVLELEISRVTSTRQQETKIGSILRKLGWTKKRDSKVVNGYRGYYYARIDES